MTRQRVLSVRIGADERNAWGRSASASDSRWIAQWVRATMAYAIRENLCARVRPVADADDRAVSVIHSLSLSLNDETRNAHQIGFVPESVHAIARELLDLANRTAPGRQVSVVSRDPVRQTALVNVRLSEDELEHWSALARSSGFARPATWVRYTIAELLRIDLPPIFVGVPDGLKSIRFDLGGAVTNFSQLRDLAASSDVGLADKLDQYGVESVRLLSRYRDGAWPP